MRALALAAILALASPWAAGAEAPDAAQQWLAAHPVVRVAIDPQQGAEIQRGLGQPLVSGYMGIVERRLGVRFSLVRTASWEDSVKAFREGRVDVLPSLTDRLLTADVGGGALLSRPIYVGRTVIVTRTVGPATLGLSYFDGRTLALKGNGQYESWLRREHPQVRLLPLADVHQVLAAVESGVADGAIGTDQSYHPIVRRDFALSLRVAGDVPEAPVTVRLVVHPQDRELLALIDQVMSNITPQESEEVLERWLQTAYLRAPSLALIMRVYRVEVGLALALVLVLVFAVWQMRRAQMASRRGEQQKTMLLAVMSHEVRNSVNAVVSSIELLSKSPVEGPQRDLMAIAHASARNLQAVLHSALDYTRAETQGFTPDPQRCDAVAVAREVLEAHRPSIDQKGLEARLDLPMGPLPWLMLDETRLRQLLDNLVSNAVKFTDAGHVGIALWETIMQEADDVRFLVVDVFDTGSGVPEQRRRQLFKPFSQAHGAKSRRLGGAGLGLSICREIVRNLGGRFTFNSEEGVGTSVRIELPTSLVPVAAGGSDVREDAAELAGGTVLLVEDHPANRQIITAQLRYLGYETCAVDHGQAAIDAFQPGQFVAVLLDCELPDIPGYDIAVELRARERAAAVPPATFIAISANDGEEHLDRCADCGIDLVLGKPLSLKRLRTALARSSNLGSVRDVFRTEALADLEALVTAVREQAWDRAMRSAHRIHGAALVLGATREGDVAQALEAEMEGGRDPGRIDALVAELRQLLG
jgi:signal transduction histidine kinase/CheY-like chemotaxis protein